MTRRDTVPCVAKRHWSPSLVSYPSRCTLRDVCVLPNNRPSVMGKGKCFADIGDCSLLRVSSGPQGVATPRYYTAVRRTHLCFCVIHRPVRAGARSLHKLAQLCTTRISCLPRIATPLHLRIDVHVPQVPAAPTCMLQGDSANSHSRQSQATTLRIQTRLTNRNFRACGNQQY